MNKGGKNLVILGILAIFIAILTSSISLVIYHNSGDIYLDRSRPGFLPDEKEEEIQNIDYKFEENRETISDEEINEFIENLDYLSDKIKSVSNSFSSESLSDESLGISK